jgi:5-oxoprolinase (ATP-hydrolysing)
MNPISKELWEEGVAVKSFRLVSQGVFEEQGVRDLFNEVAKYPGCSATRRIDHNLTDLQGESTDSLPLPRRLRAHVVRSCSRPYAAAISANVRGIKLVNRLFEEFGTKTVLFYMHQIQLVAQQTIKAFFRETYEKFGGKPLRARDIVSTPDHNRLPG